MAPEETCHDGARLARLRGEPDGSGHRPGHADPVATVGEVFAERAGVLNLGIEGMMLLGAMTGYGVARATGSAWLGLVCAMLAAGALSLLHALVTVGLRADQVVSGLGLTFVGTGLSAVLGAPLCDSKAAVARLPELRIPVLEHIPVLGPILFARTPSSFSASFSCLLRGGFSTGRGPGFTCAP